MNAHKILVVDDSSVAYPLLNHLEQAGFKKNAILFILICILALGLAACSSSENAAQDTSVAVDTSTAQTEPTETVAEEEADSAAETGEEVSTDYSYTIVDTDQTWCFSDSEAVECDEVFVGQDAQYEGLQPAYQDNGDGTITDLNTGLMWIQDAGNKTTYADAMEELQTYTFAGYDDWRLPTIKELYSLALFSGVDASMASSSDVDGLWPLIDDDYFTFLYGDENGGQRVIDAQWLSSNVYVSTVFGDQSCFFGFNFSDGRIKCYGLDGLGPSGGYFAQYVRGGDDYGVNDFVENGDDTITDNATGLTWTQNDNGEALDWDSALNYCETLSLGGSDEWRLPNIKELHSLVDYGRSPDSTNSAAIDRLFNMTQITNEAGEPDYGFYWGSTTLISYPSDVSWANYISFGRALGYQEQYGGWVDVHGAGAQRSDPKVPGEEFEFGNGPQGDAVRQYNYALCVSGGVAEPSDGDAPSTLILSDVEIEATEGGEVPTIGEGNSQAQPGGEVPDLAAVAATLGITEDELMAALESTNQNPPDFEAAAAELGVTVEELEAALMVNSEPTDAPQNGTNNPQVTDMADAAEMETFDTTAGIQAAQWGDNVSITLGEDTFRYQSSGMPNHELPEKFLIPKDPADQPFSNKTLDDFNVVTTTEYLSESPIDVTLTLHPTYAEEVTPTDLGSIGYIISGARLFNDYENAERSVVALDDNISFDFDDSGHDHAAFVDECNGHPLASGLNYHYHGVPTCITEVVDVEGDHSHIIGVLRDGFPVYGNLGEDGVPVTNADLDACSGHFGPTPESPDGIYHYHLTDDEAPYSVDCYKGVVDASTGDATGNGGPLAGDGQNSPDFGAAAEKLGVSEEALQAALGDPPPDFAAAAAALGVTEAELMEALGVAEGGGPGGG